MKRLLCLLLAVCAALSLTACNGGVTPSDVSSTPSMNTVDTSFDFDDRITEDKDLTAKGYPPLPLDQQILWQDAQEMAAAFALCKFNTAGVTREIGGMTYDVIVDDRFGSYEEMKTYLQTLFTDSYIYSELLTADSPVKPSSDKLACVIQASGASDITYAGHVFTVDSRTADRIQMTAKVYYADDAYNGEPFYKTPKKPSDYTTKDLAFEMIRTEDGWRFSKCPYIQE
ncbi:MAG: hypothetical protein IJP35_01965 [Clostridia bacterium]|nr:hypothetical protein [Clostridia bacterium]